MKSTNTEVTNVFHEYQTVEQAVGTKYKLRTEFRIDCTHIRAMLRPWLLSWKEASGYQADDSYVDDGGVIWASQNWTMETDVEFIVREKGPTLNEIRWLINAKANLHVAAQTVERIDNYTGERIDYKELDVIAIPPSDELVKEVIDFFKKRKMGFELDVDSSQGTIERLQAQLGDDEPYKRRLAKMYAQMFIENGVDMGTVDPRKLEKAIYKNTSIDSTGGHCIYGGFDIHMKC